MKKLATLLLVLLMIGGLFGVSVTAIEQPAEITAHDLPVVPIKPLQEGIEHPIGLEDPDNLKTLKNQPFSRPTEEEDSAEGDSSVDKGKGIEHPIGLEGTELKSADPSAMRTWQNLPDVPIKLLQEGIEHPIGLEDPDNLRRSKSKPFIRPPKEIYSVEEDSSIDKVIEHPIGVEGPDNLRRSKSKTFNHSTEEIYLEDSSVGKKSIVSSLESQPLAPSQVSNFEAVSNADNPGLNDGRYFRPPDPILAVTFIVDKFSQWKLFSSILQKFPNGIKVCFLHIFIFRMHI